MFDDLSAMSATFDKVCAEVVAAHSQPDAHDGDRKLAGHADIPGDVFRNPARLQSGGNPGADAYLAVGRHTHGTVDGHSEHYGPARDKQRVPGCRPGHDCGDAGYRPDDHADPAENLFEDIEDTFGFHGVEAIHDLFQLLLVDLGALFSLGVDGGHAVFGGLRARLVADHLGQRFEREPSRRGRGQPRQV